jgi:zinc-finger of transposase IS204/IS1001/IS1096/IS1165
MCLVSTVFSGLSALVIEDVQDAGEVICVRARTPGRAVACPGCGKETASVHGYHERTVADVPVDGRRVLVRIRVRRIRCPVLGCPRQTLREQVPGVLDRYQRRTSRLNGAARSGRPGISGPGRGPGTDGAGRSRLPACRAARPAADPLPSAGTPRVLGIDLSGVPSRPSVTSANVA